MSIVIGYINRDAHIQEIYSDGRQIDSNDIVTSEKIKKIEKVVVLIDGKETEVLIGAIGNSYENILFLERFADCFNETYRPSETLRKNIEDAANKLFDDYKKEFLDFPDSFTPESAFLVIISGTIYVIEQYRSLKKLICSEARKDCYVIATQPAHSTILLELGYSPEKTINTIIENPNLLYAGGEIFKEQSAF